MQAIADFSELGEFLDMPVRYYSSGMLVRLAFSVATAIEPEILIIDEVLSAGDCSFQAKAQQRMQALISHAQAVVVVSHELDSPDANLQPHYLARPRADPHVGPGQRRSLPPTWPTCKRTHRAARHER